MTAGTTQTAATGASRPALTRSAWPTGCELGLLLGDNFYPLGDGFSRAKVRSADDPRWETTVHSPYADFPSDFRFWAMLGNHDLTDGNHPQAQIDHTDNDANTGQIWMMPDRNYDAPKLPEWLQLRVIDSNLLAYERVADGARDAGEDDQLDLTTQSLAEASATWKRQQPPGENVLRRRPVRSTRDARGLW